MLLWLLQQCFSMFLVSITRECIHKCSLHEFRLKFCFNILAAVCKTLFLKFKYTVYVFLDVYTICFIEGRKAHYSRDTYRYTMSNNHNLNLHYIHRIVTLVSLQYFPTNVLIWCVYDKDHMSALWIKNTSESDPRSYEVTNKAQKTFNGIRTHVLRDTGVLMLWFLANDSTG